MRYEHIELNVSTTACDYILKALERVVIPPPEGPAVAEVTNFINELRARLQRRDVDQHCPLNFPNGQRP